MALGYRQYQLKLWKVRAVLVIIFCLCVLVAWSVFTRWQVEREMAARRAVVEAEYQSLQQRYDVLAADVAYLKDERSLESEIRKLFDVAKEGESVVIILDDPAAAEATSTRATSALPTGRWWQFWR